MTTIKTPVMVLQELTVKKGIQTPEYNIIHAKQGTHDNEFHYQVIVANVSAIGVGRSKQVAKHDAARKALDKLESLGLYKPGETVVKAPRSEVPNSPINKPTINSIGILGELCLENKIPFPNFTEISDVGPPHCKEFTYECTIASLVTRATAGTKKQAKQLAAKEMLERITHVLPELVAECNETFLQAITDKDTAAAEKYTELRRINKPKPNLALKIEDYDSNLKNLMQEKNVTVDEVNVYLQGERTEENLKALLAKLELDYMIKILQERPPIAALTINTDVPFTTIVNGESIEMSCYGVVVKAFEYLEILLSK